jgi:signal transduction histidine kinase/CheY-like chemotaxis protein/ligand-binding sensor domain-containing protein/AraC-like DNA-binding protein
MKKTFAAFLLLLIACRLASQKEASVTMLTVNDGLSQGMIFDLLQSRDGFIWIATKDGLNRYDGSRFKVFSPDPFDPFAIGGSEVQSLFEDSRGWIWVALLDGVDVLDPISGRFFHVKQAGKNIFSQWGKKIAETPDGTIWLPGNDLIWKISPQKDLLAKAAKQGSADIEPVCKAIPLSNAVGWSGGPLEANLMHFTKGKKLLVATNHGLFRLDPSSEQIVPEPLIPDYNIDCLAENKTGHILMRARQNNSNIWTLMLEGKIIYNKENLPSLFFSNTVFDDAGHIWVYNWSNKTIQKWETSVFFNNGEPEVEIPPSILHLENNGGYGCSAFMMDKSGIVWVGTSGYGVVKINDKGQKFKTALPGTAHRLLYEDPDGALYTGSLPDKKFLSKSFDRSAPNTDLPLFGDNNRPISLALDPAGNMWWMRKDGNQIYRMDAATKVKTAFSFEGNVVICDRNGKLVSVNTKGLHRFDPATQASQHFPFEKPQKQLSENSYFVYEDSEGAVWVFGFEGLTKATPTQGGYRYQQYLNDPADRNSLSINHVLSVCDDPLEPHRYGWVGTKGGGLNRLDKQTGTFKKYSTAEGLPDNVVYGILAQDKAPYIWLSTNKGLCRFDVRAETTKNFTVLDGLQDNEFNGASYLKTKDGYLIFGGVNGINVFHPDSLRFNENVPQVQIVGLSVNTQPFPLTASSLIPQTSSLKLSHDQNLLTFDFAALEFTNPSQNQYRYQLVGVDKDWVALGNKNSIQFANLAPGDYTFRVDGSNNDGTWSGQPAELRFTIRPPWWNSWWAYLIYLAAAAVAVWLFYRNRLRQRIEQQEALRLREMDEFKGRFFTNITHEFRTPLTVILGMGDQLLKAETDAQKQSKLGLIKRNGESLLRLINQILDLAKLESKTLKINYIQGDVLTYLRYIAESLHSYANAQNVMLRVESDQASIVMDYDPERLLQIVHNLLSNAIKFTPSGGRVVVRVSTDLAGFKNLPSLKIEVSDSGVGVPPEELPFLFERFFQAKNQEHSKAGGTGIGLSLTHELVKALGGEISVESTVGVGTTFLVKLPITNKSAFVESGANMTLEGWKSSAVKPQVPLPSATLPTDSNLPQILLVEDNPDVVEYLAACLTSPQAPLLRGEGSERPPLLAGEGPGARYALDFAYNGRAGIEKALETIPDLIVSDVMMPEKDGFEVVEALKNDERTSHIPIILLTAKADVESRLKGLRRGADAYLSKPFHQEELLVTVANLLEMRRKLQERFRIADFGLRIGGVPENSEIENPQSEIEDAFIQKFRSIVEANLSDSDFEMPQLERALAMSRSQIFRKVKALTGKSPSLFIRSIRLHHGRHLLQTTTLTVSEIAYEVGYAALNNFSDAFFEEFGERPTGMRRKD